MITLQRRQNGIYLALSKRAISNCWEKNTGNPAHLEISEVYCHTGKGYISYCQSKAKNTTKGFMSFHSHVLSILSFVGNGHAQSPHVSRWEI